MKKFLLLVFAFLIFPFFVSAADKVEINTASLQQLETLTGIGPVKAQATIDARPFSSVDDLLRVKGIGEKTLQKIKDQGLAYVDGQGAQSIFQTPPETPPEVPSEAPAEPLDVFLPAETPPRDVIAPIVYPSNIVINEILPSPNGPDEKEEWIEIFNQNNFKVDLSGWKIEDVTGKTTAYLFREDAEIPAKGFLVLPRAKTNITLNNGEDGLNIFQPDGNIADSVIYKEAPRGQSYGKFKSGWAWTATYTPGVANIQFLPKIEEDKKPRTDNDPILNSDGEDKINKDLAAVGEYFPKRSNAEIIFLTAAGIAVLSGAVFIFLKKKIKIN
ncbi:MAG: hypothetical protein COU98_01770 [Candidatus Staskawiczbacteria bacterium CG10_big_fil_rev_8_21_14_0_10_38_10]|uniref:LTD domain-containing protein n=1 Tax=Candidatus Staskawiczbacteria bacterium CG10_big_fil_rev_8_21_14_0_10_38_10 TaxID=1974891 RepID=A0A2H9T184_9BACT|nr:MAG: hypothetical protein COU98_01770 [Candidatus Staskawiczbacteria bacterium CG10_big_fil_rev_8_21_14_0_10_38_10]